MSFFQEESDDSNLQYDNAAFLYFIASALIVAAITTLASLLRDLLSLRLPHKRTMQNTGFLQQQIHNLAAKKRREAITLSFFLRMALVVVLALLTLHVYHRSRAAENKMKGFDPFEILGLAPGASLREVKKAYR
jgi:preprotein translocase subunit Sec63